MLNHALFQELETYGLDNVHLEQLLAICRRRAWGSMTWHCSPSGLKDVEVNLKTSMRDSRGMRDLTTLLEKEH